MKRVVLVTAALVAAVTVLALALLPPRRVALDASWTDGSIPGLIHIHTNRSDGRSGTDEIASAAARAGLKFIVFTDHGDATRKPDPPTYRSGVLCLDGVEISTKGGHYVVIGMPASPYPLAGEPRDVVEDVKRLGGFGIAAHPDSPREELQWTDWDTPIDGLELINPDTSWRVHLFGHGWRSKFPLARALLTYPFRASETIGSLLTNAPTVEDHWNTLAERGRVVGLAGADAHAKLELRASDPGTARFSLPLPGYESSFRTLSLHVTTGAPLTGDALIDGRAVLDGIRNGRAFTVVDAWASPPAFEFTATNESGVAHAGDVLPVAGPVSLHTRSNAPSQFQATVWRGSQVIQTVAADQELTIVADEGSAVYRVEIRDLGRPWGPAWLISNPIYVRGAPIPEAPLAPAAITARLPLFDGHSTNGWTLENDSTSLAALEAVQMEKATELRLRYGLSGGQMIGQFSGAAVETTHGLSGYDRVAFTIRAEHPMRISVQVRTEANGAPSRWQRTVYVDAADAERVVAFHDMRPVGTTATALAVAENVRAILFIVDTTNTKPGASGRIWLKNVRLEKTG